MHPKQILIAPDSFKGSLSATEAANAIAKGLAARGIHDTYCLPVADGGEGTLDALVPREKQIELTVTGTSGKPVLAAYGCSGRTAVIEMARAAGLTLTPEEERNVMTATTFGVGELIRHALDAGYRDFLLTVGGSGTNDGGCGMMAALGATFYTADGNEFFPTGGTLDQITRIGIKGLDGRLAECRFTIATDVKNPLLGKNGATYVYAKQKGCADEDLPRMEAGMAHYAALLQALCHTDVSDVAGCGAGGGISAPLVGLLEAPICSGIEAVLKALRFDRMVRGADAVITGEGRIDRQSLFGKAISGVAKSAAGHGVPVYVLAGCLGDDRDALLEMGLADIRTLTELSDDASYCMEHAAELLEQLAGTLFE